MVKPLKTCESNFWVFGAQKFTSLTGIFMRGSGRCLSSVRSRWERETEWSNQGVWPNVCLILGVKGGQRYLKRNIVLIQTWRGFHKVLKVSVEREFLIKSINECQALQMTPGRELVLLIVNLALWWVKKGLTLSGSLPDRVEYTYLLRLEVIADPGPDLHFWD